MLSTRSFVRYQGVALRKESVDRNAEAVPAMTKQAHVALRKESVDRNNAFGVRYRHISLSLSARRAWIEITQCRL